MGRKEEVVVVVGRYGLGDSDSDSDHDRYVFLARQPQKGVEAGSGGDGDVEGAVATDEGSDSSAGKARVDHLTRSGSESRRTRGKIEKKKRGRCDGSKSKVQRAERGKRTRVQDGDRSHRDVPATAAAAAEAASTAEASRRFLCKLCGMCFGSPRALGGHVSAHRNKAKRDTVVGTTHEEKTAASMTSAVAASNNHDGFRGNGDNQSEDGVIATSDGTERKIAVPRCHKLTKGNGDKNASKPAHRCGVCGREFLTGQALGGHKRKHWTPPSIRRRRMIGGEI